MLQATSAGPPLLDVGRQYYASGVNHQTNTSGHRGRLLAGPIGRAIC